MARSPSSTRPLPPAWHPASPAPRESIKRFENDPTPCPEAAHDLWAHHAAAVSRTPAGLHSRERRAGPCPTSAFTYPLDAPRRRPPPPLPLPRLRSRRVAFPAKFTVAFASVYHLFGACRHLYWDKTAQGFSNPAMRQSSYALLAASTVVSLALATTSWPQKAEPKKK